MRDYPGVWRRTAVVITAIFMLSGCVTTSHHTGKGLAKDESARRVLVLPPDVELSILHAGGIQEPNAEWTRLARRHIADDLGRRFREMKVSLVNGDNISAENADDAEELQMLKLHEAVGWAILTHQYATPLQLPTKANGFEWSLGPKMRTLKQKYGGDYALFLFVRDSYASSGRVATMIVAAMLGVGIEGGVQVGFASLVDLNTGEVVWFNRLVRGGGDLRTAPAAQETVSQLLANFPK
jgi:hypothetical protein